MKSTTHNKISDEPFHNFYEEETFELAKRLVKENDAKPSNILKNYYLLRSLETLKPELTFDYIDFLDQELFDAN